MGVMLMEVEGVMLMKMEMDGSDVDRDGDGWE